MSDDKFIRISPQALRDYLQSQEDLKTERNRTSRMVTEIVDLRNLVDLHKENAAKLDQKVQELQARVEFLEDELLQKGEIAAAAPVSRRGGARRRRRPWSDQEVNTLRSMRYGNVTFAKIAQAVGRSISDVYDKAGELGIKPWMLQPSGTPDKKPSEPGPWRGLIPNDLYRALIEKGVYEISRLTGKTRWAHAAVEYAKAMLAGRGCWYRDVANELGVTIGALAAQASKNGFKSSRPNRGACVPKAIALGSEGRPLPADFAAFRGELLSKGELEASGTAAPTIEKYVNKINEQLRSQLRSRRFGKAKGNKPPKRKTSTHRRLGLSALSKDHGYTIRSSGELVAAGVLLPDKNRKGNNTWSPLAREYTRKMVQDLGCWITDVGRALGVTRGSIAGVCKKIGVTAKVTDRPCKGVELGSPLRPVPTPWAKYVDEVAGIQA